MIRPEEIEVPSPTRVNCDTSQTGIRVLLAEDDRALRRYLEVVLQRAGYDVALAGDGLAAMKVLVNSVIDVVVTDAIMPNVSGYELSRFVRSSPRLSHVPIVLLSGSDRKAAGSETEHVNVFLSKPVSPEELLDCLERLLEVRCCPLVAS